MSLNKIIHLQKAIDRQLEYFSFTSIGNNNILVKFNLTNEPFSNEFNVVEVESIDEANKIVNAIVIEKTKVLDRSNIDYSKPLFLSVVVILPS